MKGILLAGGNGTRLYPTTKVLSKQLLPICDKPMIYYPLSTLMLANISEILIITRPEDEVLFKKLLGDGSELGISLSYAVQSEPRGLADAFIIGANFIGNDSVCLILGDNLFYTAGLSKMLKEASELTVGARIYAHYVKDPSGYGVIEIDSDWNPISIEEKPINPKSHYAIPGLYFFDNEVKDIVKKLHPSARGELEITDVIKAYMDKGSLGVQVTARGMVWLDMGTNENFNEASNYVETIQKRQGLYIACLEEIAYRKKFITIDKLRKLAEPLITSDYGQYLMEVYRGL